jgi:hypothetical protein
MIYSHKRVVNNKIIKHNKNNSQIINKMLYHKRVLNKIKNQINIILIIKYRRKYQYMMKNHKITQNKIF